MAKINAKLLAAIMNKTGLSRAQTYARIQQTANRETLPRDLAAIKLGSEVGVNINKYADTSQLAQLRQAGTPVVPPDNTALVAPTPRRAASKGRGKGTKGATKPPNQVFVVYGRDRIAKDAMFAFLRAVGVKPIEWNSALAMSKKAAPTPFKLAFSPPRGERWKHVFPVGRPCVWEAVVSVRVGFWQNAWD